MSLEEDLPDEPFITVKEAADFLRVDRATIYRHLQSNPELAVQPNGTAYRIIKSRFLNWIESGMKSGGERGKETAESTTAPSTQ